VDALGRLSEESTDLARAGCGDECSTVYGCEESPCEFTAAPRCELRQFSKSTGTAEPSITASLLEELSRREDAPEDEEDVVRNVGSMAYAAATDTVCALFTTLKWSSNIYGLNISHYSSPQTVSAISSFMLAMVLYPDAQRKAQAELDSAIGLSRLPGFEDRENLPYVNALCKEVLRWNPVSPLGIAHRVTQDDIYGDYFIPGGSIIIGNTWCVGFTWTSRKVAYTPCLSRAMLHDDEMYGPKPEEFEPERFLKPGVRDPTVAFGYGRRFDFFRHFPASRYHAYVPHAEYVPVAIWRTTPFSLL
jgi:hypothetical protein